MRLPSGTCRANNPALRADGKAMQHWNSWCDVNCVPSKWGAVGEGGCRDGSETGVVGCVCKPDVTPVKAAALTLSLSLSLTLSLSLSLTLTLTLTLTR